MTTASTATPANAATAVARPPNLRPDARVGRSTATQHYETPTKTASGRTFGGDMLLSGATTAGGPKAGHSRIRLEPRARCRLAGHAAIAPGVERPSRDVCLALGWIRCDAG